MRRYHPDIDPASISDAVRQLSNLSLQLLDDMIFWADNWDRQDYDEHERQLKLVHREMAGRGLEL